MGTVRLSLIIGRSNCIMKKMVVKLLTVLIIGVVAYFTKGQILDNVSSPILRAIGGVMIVLALLYIFYEIKRNLDFFYGKSQSAGSNANGSVVAGIGIGIFAANMIELAVIIVLFMAYIVIISK